jgi:hypothetical protein
MVDEVVTGRLKTSHLWALQNQPPLAGISIDRFNNSRWLSWCRISLFSLAECNCLFSAAGPCVQGPDLLQHNSLSWFMLPRSQSRPTRGAHWLVLNRTASQPTRRAHWLVLNRPQTVTEGVQLDGLHSVRRVRAGRSEGVLVVRFELFFTDHALHLPR